MNNDYITKIRTIFKMPPLSRGNCKISDNIWRDDKNDNLYLSKLFSTLARSSVSPWHNSNKFDSAIDMG